MLFSDDITLPRFSNREDLYLLVGIYDDDTGDPLNLSGTTGSGTFAAWTIVASMRKHRSAGGIFVVNFFLGWTFGMGHCARLGFFLGATNIEHRDTTPAEPLLVKGKLLCLRGMKLL